MTVSVPHFLVLGAVAALVVSGCRDTTLRSGCSKDADCGTVGSAFRCEASTGTCYCRTDQGCKPSEFCNPSGFCQSRAGCEKNADCVDPSQYCDTTTGTCLAKNRCNADIHCALGQVCDRTRSICVEGCRSHGDCDGVACRCGTQACACPGTTPEERAKCTLGVCDPNYCASEAFCQFGERCGVAADAGTDLAQCFTDFDPDRRPYCANCTFGGGQTVCGHGANYCLADTAHPGNSFCGVDCTDTQSCPRGYACQDVVVVFSRWRCTRADPSCPGNPTLPCAQDSECKRGGQCLKTPGAATGLCGGNCAIDEGSPEGFCSCQVDDDCAQETCTAAGECSISRKSCVTDQDCRAIRCIDYQGSGGCFIGQNCAPAEGLTCLEVQ